MKKEVVITGGAGSLGRAFVKYLLAQEYEPSSRDYLYDVVKGETTPPSGLYDVIVVDSSEWAIAEMRSLYPEATYWLGDFVDYPLKGSEDIIIHAAAYKHIDLGESNVASFINNNVTKTIKFYENAGQTLARVLFISTDKAVEPNSAYGFTKSLGELLTKQIGGSVARCGNFLLSSGSVVPVWEAQIAANKPITITDERMTRYVIEINEAVSQIWAQFMEGRQLIVPDMGEPMRLLDLMAEVLKRHGYKQASDYKPGVQLIGMRPGEKLHEKLVWDNELAL